MERTAFIHGSSAGQSVVIPTNALTPICKHIADFYFEGRSLRMKSSNARCALFVELIRDTQGGSYCLYSFVNNNCSNPTGRKGQYFAISILCKEFYVADFGKVYRFFNAFYEEIVGKDVIFDKRTVGNDKLVYKIAQFSDELKRVEACCTAVEKAFDKEFAAICKPLPPNVKSADYDGWTGAQISRADCASPSTKDALFKSGRVYISDKYQSSSRQVDDSREQIARLHAENANLREQVGASDAEQQKNLVGNVSFNRKDFLYIALHIFTLILVIVLFRDTNSIRRLVVPLSETDVEQTVETVEEEVTSTPELSLSLGGKMLHFEAKGGKETVPVVTNGTVECTCSENWITAAENGGVITVAVKENKTKAPRRATITVSSSINDETKAETITVTQKSKISDKGMADKKRADAASEASHNMVSQR